MNKQQRKPDRFMREAEELERSGLSRMTRHRLRAKGEYPKKRRVSAGVSATLESEFEEWQASREIIEPQENQAHGDTTEQPQVSA